MRVLVACEFSGTVRDAFLRHGHDAVSCDLLPTEAPGPHIVGDARDAVREPWDLVIAHPPCTYLSKAGARWLADPGRLQLVEDGAEFFRAMLEANAPRVAVENPVMHGVAAKLVGRPPTQYVQPYEHGHYETKNTGLWLKGLLPLAPTANCKTETMALPAKERGRLHWLPPTPDRWKLRSVTYAGIAEAMASQWGDPTPVELPLEVDL